MAPAAAHLAAGVAIDEFGPVVDPASLAPGLVALPQDDPDGKIAGEVLWVDRFGNCQLNIGPEELTARGLEPGARIVVKVGERGAVGPLGAHVLGREGVRARRARRFVRHVRAGVRPTLGREPAQAARRPTRDRDDPAMRWGTSLVLVALLVLILAAAVIQFVFRV